MLLIFFVNNNSLKVSRKFHIVSMSPGFMSTQLTYAWEKVPFYKYIPVVNIFLLLVQLVIMLGIMTYCLRYAHNITCIHTHAHAHIQVYTYIHHGHIWHRNKLSRSQMEILGRYSNDEHQTSLKWDRSSHPVAPECRVSQTLSLKMFTINVLCFCVSCSLRLNVPLTGKRGVMSDVNYPDGLPKAVIYLPKSTHNIFPSCCIALFSTCRNVF
jgi:hypothetical protein